MNEQLSTEQRIAPSCLPALLIRFAGYRGCALLAKDLLFAFHKARESLTKDSPTCSSVVFGAFPPHVQIVSFVPHLAIANRYCITVLICNFCNGDEITWKLISKFVMWYFPS